MFTFLASTVIEVGGTEAEIRKMLASAEHIYMNKLSGIMNNHEVLLHIHQTGKWCLQLPAEPRRHQLQEEWRSGEARAPARDRRPPTEN